MDSQKRLEEIFTHFPGIGPRQARRFVYYLMNRPSSFINEFIQLVTEVKKQTNECRQCHRIFIETTNKKGLFECDICVSETRDESILMIVARDSDFDSIEKSGEYNGKYFVLGGTVPILDKDPEKRIRLRTLLGLITSNTHIKEIILSLSTTPDGEHTADIVTDAIRSVLDNRTIKLSTLGRGLSTGAELEYADGETIRNALKNRN